MELWTATTAFLVDASVLLIAVSRPFFVPGHVVLQLVKFRCQKQSACCVTYLTREHSMWDSEIIAIEALDREATKLVFATGGTFVIFRSRGYSGWLNPPGAKSTPVVHNDRSGKEGSSVDFKVNPQTR